MKSAKQNQELIRDCSAGAAGNFLAPFLQLSTNAFRAVVEIGSLEHSESHHAISSRICQEIRRK